MIFRDGGENYLSERFWEDRPKAVRERRELTVARTAARDQEC